jgi:hypothetical protein
MSYRNEIIHVFVCMNRVNEDRLSLGGRCWCFVGLGAIVLRHVC